MKDREREKLEQTVRKQEDVIFGQSAGILRAHERHRVAMEELEKIAKLIGAKPANAAAVAANKAEADKRAARVRALKGQGKSIAQTAQLTGLSTRTVSRLRKGLTRLDLSLARRRRASFDECTVPGIVEER